MRLRVKYLVEIIQDKQIICKEIAGKRFEMCQDTNCGDQ
jgi:hypothetical protein